VVCVLTLKESRINREAILLNAWVHGKASSWRPESMGKLPLGGVGLWESCPLEAVGLWESCQPVTSCSLASSFS